MFEVFNHSIVGKARMNNYVDIEIINIRDFSNNKHNKVDDYPFGGGAGMLMSVEPIYNSICYARRNLDGRVIYLGPRGDTFNQNKAYELSDNNHLIFSRTIFSCSRRHSLRKVDHFKVSLDLFNQC